MNDSRDCTINAPQKNADTGDPILSPNRRRDDRTGYDGNWDWNWLYMDLSLVAAAPGPPEYIFYIHRPPQPLNQDYLLINIYIFGVPSASQCCGLLCVAFSAEWIIHLLIICRLHSHRILYTSRIDYARILNGCAWWSSDRCWLCIWLGGCWWR